MPHNSLLNSQTTNPTISTVDFYQGNNSITAADGLVLVLSGLSFFIHPFFVLISVTLLQVFIKIKPAFILPVFCLSLALYWSLRNIGVSWDGGFDDAVGYIESFQTITKDSIFSLFRTYIAFPAGNEIGFNLMVYCVRLFTSNERIFLFIIYLTMLSLLAISSLRISKRYYLVIIALVFFGVGGFVEQAALHLFRATLASLLLFVATSLYNENRKHSFFFFIAAALFHTAAVPLIIFYLTITNRKYFSNLLSLVLISLLIVIGLKYVVSIDTFLIESSRASYILTDGGKSREAITLAVIAFIFAVFNRAHNDNIYRFSFFITCLLVFLYLILPEYAFIAGRYLYIIQLFTALLVFKILMNIKFKPAICCVLIMFFVRKIMVLNSSEFIIGAFDNFSNMFSAPFFILLN